MAAFVFFILSSCCLVAGGVFGVKMMDQAWRDRQRKTYRLAFPSDLDEERVTAWLRTLSGTLRVNPVRRLLEGSPAIVLEVRATNLGITHRLRIPWQYEKRVKPKLESLVPGIRLTAEDEFPHSLWVHAVEIGLRNGGRGLHIPSASDMAVNILTNFTDLDEGETLSLQWVVSPAAPEHKPIYGTAVSQESSWRAVLGGSMASRDEVQERRDKLEEPNMLAALRIGAVAGTKVRAQFLVTGVKSSMDAARGPSTKFYVQQMNTLKGIQQRMDRGATPLAAPVQVSVPELTALIGWPLNNPLIVGLQPTVSRYLPASENVPRAGRVLGTSTVSGRERPIAMSYDEAFRHVHVIGGNGSGKTNLLASTAIQDIKADYGVVVIDGKGDLFHEVLDRIPEEHQGRVIVFDFNDHQRPLGFNVLEQAPDATVVDQVVGVWKALFGDNPSLWTEEMMRYGLQTLMLDKRSTIIDLMALISPAEDEKAWAAGLQDAVTDRQVRNFWQRFENYGRARQDLRAEPLLTRTFPLTNNRLMNVLGQTESSFRMDDVMRDGTILLVNLAGVEPSAAAMMGTLLVNTLWSAAQRQQRPPDKGTFLYLDEFHRFMKLPVDMEQMMVEARSRKLGLVMAHQYLDQIKDSSLRQAVMSNAKTKIAFQLDVADARTMSASFGLSVSNEDLQHLARFEAITRVSTRENVSAPLTMSTIELPRGNGNAGKIWSASRERYGRDVDAVQSEMVERRTSTQTRNRRRPPIDNSGWVPID